MAAPSPVVTLTLMPPIMLQTRIYQIMFLLPYLSVGSVLVEHVVIWGDQTGARAGRDPNEMFRRERHVLWAEVKYDGEGAYYGHRGVGEETRSEKEFLKLSNLAHRVLLGTCTEREETFQVEKN